MLNFLKNYQKYEYATKDSRHFAASLIFHALEYSALAILGVVLFLYVLKLLFMLGVL